MEPPAALEIGGKTFLLHSTETRGSKRYAIRRYENGGNIEFLATRIEEKGQRGEKPLAVIEGARQPYHQDEFYVQEIRNAAGTVEGARMLSRLYDHMEAHLKGHSIRSFTADALLNVYDFFRRKGYSASSSAAAEKLARYKRRFAELKNSGKETEDARRSARLGAGGATTIFMRKDEPGWRERLRAKLRI